MYLYTFSYIFQSFTLHEWNPLWMCSLWDFRSPPQSSLHSRPSPRHQTTPGWVWLLCGGEQPANIRTSHTLKKKMLLYNFILVVHFYWTHSPSDRQRQLDDHFGLDLDGNKVFLHTCPDREKRRTSRVYLFVLSECISVAHAGTRDAAAFTFAAAARCRSRWRWGAWPWCSGWCGTSSGWTNK